MEKQTTQQAEQAAKKAVQPETAQKASEAQEQAREPEIYTIKIVPDKGDEVRSIRLSSRWLKFGLGSLAVGAMLFVGAFSYAVYSTFTHRSDAAEIQELRQVNSIQQEQLLNLSKKANALQDQMEELTQKEQELRRLSGASPAKDDPQANGQQQAGASAPDASGNEEEQHDGQGGPYVAPDIDNVNAVLDDWLSVVPASRLCSRNFRSSSRSWASSCQVSMASCCRAARRRACGRPGAR